MSTFADHPNSLAHILGRPPRNEAFMAALGLGPRACVRCTGEFTPPPYAEFIKAEVCPACRTVEWHQVVAYHRIHGCFPEDGESIIP